MLHPVAGNVLNLVGRRHGKLVEDAVLGRVEVDRAELRRDVVTVSELIGVEIRRSHVVRGTKVALLRAEAARSAGEAGSARIGAPAIV